MLVGQPPFETETLNETYKRITNNQYRLPAQLSAAAADLISRLLHPSPRLRPTTGQMLQHQFFQTGPLLTSLPALCCSQPPPLPPPAGRPASQLVEHIPPDQGRLPASRSELRLSPARGAGRLVRSQSVKDNSRLTDKVGSWHGTGPVRTSSQGGLSGLWCTGAACRLSNQTLFISEAVS